MRTSPIRYGTRFGCRFGQPHDLQKLGETPHQTWERCKICGVTKSWNKGYKGRVENAEYLKAHVRQYAQEFGSTRRVFMKLYHPSECVINL